MQLPLFDDSGNLSLIKGLFFIYFLYFFIFFLSHSDIETVVLCELPIAQWELDEPPIQIILTVNNKHFIFGEKVQTNNKILCDKFHKKLICF